MKNQVIIKADSKTGNVVTMKTQTNKTTGEETQVGSVRIESTAYTNWRGQVRTSKRTAFLSLNEDVLSSMEPLLVDGGVFPMPGKIVVEETLTPYIKKNGKPQEAKINPSTKEVITFQGQPVYRNSYFSTDLDAQDVLLKDNASTSNDAEE